MDYNKHSEIINLIDCGSRIPEKRIKLKYRSFYDEVIKFNKANFPDVKFRQKYYNYINNIKENPKCNGDDCDNSVGFTNRHIYSGFCSIKCSTNSNRVKEKRMNTTLERYGVEHNSQMDTYKEKYKKTMIDRYGVSHPMKSPKLKEKLKQTNIKKYGFESRFMDEEFRNKIKSDFKDKYGVENPFELDQVKEKIKITNLERYGAENPYQSEEIKKKIRKTNLEKYGVEHIMQNKEFSEKAKSTNLERYGVEYTLSSEEIKKKIRKTNLEKYGVEHISQNINIRKKMNNTIKLNRIKKYKKRLNHDDIEYLDNDMFLINNYCDKHNQFEINASNILNRLRINLPICTKCYPISEQVSIKEAELRKWASDLGIDVEFNNRKILNGKEIDIYFPTHNVGVEFDGVYYHSDMFVDNDYHLNKTIISEENGIMLIHIFEDEWINKNKIIKSIIKSKLGIYDNIITANDCIIKELDINVYNSFLSENSIGNIKKVDIMLGLSHRNNLISVMGFNDENESEYVLETYCNKSNMGVNSGMGVLFNYFVDKFNPYSVNVFVDRRFFTGKSYEDIKFKLYKTIPINYYYVMGITRYDINEILTTNKNADNPDKIGCLKIFDCGMYHYKWTK